VVTALAFDFTNGFHDTANAMATSVATGALKPKAAVALSAILNLIGAFLSIEVALRLAARDGRRDGWGRQQHWFVILVPAVVYKP
jgi:phosphate/sulfate permease